jgi:membrane-bound inhibitor of C-type lysozyme
MKATIERELLTEITEVIEDTVEYACDQHTLSGELVWTIVESLATAKIAQLQGLVD